MLLRAETAADHDAIYRLNAAAFASTAEARLVDALRDRADPFLSLVAEESGEIVAHVAFSPVTLDTAPDLFLLGLGPMAVAPARQREGIGTELVREGLRRCRELGAAGVVVLGHVEYYPRFGFGPAREHGVDCAYDVPAEAFMLLELTPGALRDKCGRVRYHDVFAEVEAR